MTIVSLTCSDRPPGHPMSACDRTAVICSSTAVLSALQAVGADTAAADGGSSPKRKVARRPRGRRGSNMGSSSSLEPGAAPGCAGLDALLAAASTAAPQVRHEAWADNA